ncbi:hypothetical protein EDC96DRAFT_547962 [Choanephora cucurbitarum]|nr:hypothetical protein EDC96DRAFT_547962 [Choanephora cucurbitarum]
MAGSTTNSRKKKNNKNKNKKQSTPVSSDVNSTPIDHQDNPIDQESVTATQEGGIAQLSQTNVSPTGPIAVGAQGATDSGLAALDAKNYGHLETNTTNTANILNTTTLPEYIKHGIHSVVASKSIDIDGILKKVVQNVQAGRYEEKIMCVQNKSLANSKATIATNQPEFSEQPNTQSQVNLPTEVKKNNSIKPGVSPKNTDDTTTVGDAGIAVTAGGVGATLAGAGVIAAAKVKQEHDEKKQELAQHLNSPSAPQPISKETIAPESLSTEANSYTHSTKISESVQHCIDSAIKAPVVDVYSITQSQKGVKCSEPAAESINQPAVPSATRAPDVPLKRKSPERVRSKTSFLKKKNYQMVLPNDLIDNVILGTKEIDTASYPSYELCSSHLCHS